MDTGKNIKMGRSLIYCPELCPASALQIFFLPELGHGKKFGRGGRRIESGDSSARHTILAPVRKQILRPADLYSAIPADYPSSVGNNFGDRLAGGWGRYRADGFTGRHNP